MKTGLIMEGGALRALFSAGVIDVMMEHHLKFDGLIGVSAGAAFGCNYKSNQAGRAIRYNKRFAHDTRYCSVRTLLKTGDIFGGEFCYHTLPEQLDIFDQDTFETNPMEFVVVCTDVETGQPVYKRIDKCGHDTYEWIRASASMPLVSKIVEVEGCKLLDGGIADSIPLAYFQQQGYRRNVVVLTQPEGYVKQPNSLMPLMRLSLRRYPKMVKAIADRHIMYNREVEYVKEEGLKGDTLVIRPKKKLPINHLSHDEAKMEACYQAGREVTLNMFDELKAFLDNK